MRSAPSLTLDPKPSRIARVCLALIVVLALLSISLSAIPILLQVALTVLTFTAAVIGMRGLTRVVLKRAVLQPDGVWLLFMKSGDAQTQISGSLISSSPLGPMIGMSWRDIDNGRVTSTLLWPDSIPQSTRRQLHVWLRSGRAHRSEPAQSGQG